MSPNRVFPSSIPIRKSLGRKGIVTTRLDNGNYYVDWGRGEAELSFLLGERILEPEDVVRGWLNAEGDVWRIIEREGFRGYPIIYSNYSDPPTGGGSIDNGRLAVRDWVFVGNNAYLTKQWPSPVVEYEDFDPFFKHRVTSLRVNPTTWGDPAKGYYAFSSYDGDNYDPPSPTATDQAVESIDWVGGDGDPPLPANAGWLRGSGVQSNRGSFHPGQDFHPDGNSFVSIDVGNANPVNPAGVSLIVMPCPFLPGLPYSVFGYSTYVQADNPDGVGLDSTAPSLFGAVRWSHNGNLIAVGMHNGSTNVSSLGPDYQGAIYRYTQQTTLRDIWVDANGMYRREYPVPPAVIPPGNDDGQFGRTLEFVTKIPVGFGVGPGSYAQTLAWTPDDRWLIMGLADTENLKPSALLAQEVAPDGTLVGDPIYWGDNPADFGVMASSAFQIGAVEFHSDGRTLAVSAATFANFEQYGTVFLCTFEDGVWGPAFAASGGGGYRGPILWLTDEHLCQGLHVLRWTGELASGSLTLMNRIMADPEPIGFNDTFGPTNIAVWPVLRDIPPDRLEGLGLID